MPSIWVEQFGIVNLEAMNYAKPIIASNIGGLPDLVKEGKNGFLVERFDVQGMAEKIVKLSKDKILAKRMGQNGRKMFRKNWTKEKHIKEIISIYRSVV